MIQSRGLQGVAKRVCPIALMLCAVFLISIVVVVILSVLGKQRFTSKQQYLAVVDPELKNHKFKSF